MKSQQNRIELVTRPGHLQFRTDRPTLQLFAEANQVHGGGKRRQGVPLHRKVRRRPQTGPEDPGLVKYRNIFFYAPSSTTLTKRIIAFYRDFIFTVRSLASVRVLEFL